MGLVDVASSILAVESKPLAAGDCTTTVRVYLLCTEYSLLITKLSSNCETLFNYESLFQI